MDLRIFARVAGVVAFALTLLGCDSWLQSKARESVDGAFPPVDYAAAQSAAVQRSLPELTAVVAPSILLNVPAESLEKALFQQFETLNVKDLAIESTTIKAGAQGFWVTANVGGVIPEPSARFRGSA